MEVDEVLACTELVGVHDVEQPLLEGGAFEVLAVEFRGHVAPHLEALDRGEVAGLD